MTTITQAPPQTAIPEPSRSRVAGRRRIPRLLKLLLLLAFVVLFLIPVYVLLVTSFKPRSEADPSRAWSLPTAWTAQAVMIPLVQLMTKAHLIGGSRA